MPESPRFKAQVQGDAAQASEEITSYSGGVVASSTPTAAQGTRLGLKQFLSDRRTLVLLLGTAGSWFLFDYAYYGNTLSLPAILKEVDATASLETKLLWTLGIFVVFAVPGYIAAVLTMDRIGHRRLQFIGFAVMAVAFLVLAAFENLTTMVAPFLAIFGLSYFFVEFGPNMTTFVLPSEVFPVSMRTTGHGIAAGVGKLGRSSASSWSPSCRSTTGCGACSPSPASPPSWGLPSPACSRAVGSDPRRHGRPAGWDPTPRREPTPRLQRRAHLARTRATRQTAPRSRRPQDSGQAGGEHAAPIA